MATKQVLITDDEERIREVVQTCLEILSGWQVITAESGIEGIRKAEAESPDVILLDVSMPDLDGAETFQRLQDNPATRAIPVILLTAKVQPDDQAQFAALAIAGVITKPFDPVKLAEQISAILGWSS
jgi:CheY-like chemotaxis protein